MKNKDKPVDVAPEFKFEVGQLVNITETGVCYSTYYSKIGDMLAGVWNFISAERFIIGGTPSKEERALPYRIIARDIHRFGSPNLYPLIEESSRYNSDKLPAVYLYGEGGLRVWEGE